MTRSSSAADATSGTGRPASPAPTTSDVWGRLSNRLGLAGVYPQLHDDVKARKTGGGIVLTRLSTDEQLTLDEDIARLLRMFNGQRSLAELIAERGEKTGSMALNEMTSLVDTLQRRGMLRDDAASVFECLDAYLSHWAVARADDAGFSAATTRRNPHVHDAEDDIAVSSRFEQLPWRRQMPLQIARVSFLRSVPTLERLDYEQLGRLALLAHEEVYPSFETVLHEAARSDHLYVIRRGTAYVLQQDADGKAMERTDELGPGDVFGHEDLLGPRFSRGDVRIRSGTSEPLELLAFDANTFHEHIRPCAPALSTPPDRNQQLLRLRRIELFADLDSNELSKLAGLIEERTIPARTVIMQQGESGDEMHVVTSGTVGIVRDGEVVARLRDGDFVGETSLLFNRPRTASVVAATDVTTLVIDKPAFSAVLGEHLRRNSRLMPTVISRLG